MAKKREYKLTIWNEKRTAQDDPSIQGNDYREPDKVFEFNGNMVVEPRDRSTGLPNSGVEPDWDQGAYIQDRGSGQPVMVFDGAPPEFFRQAWRDGQPLVGIIAIRDEARHN